MPNDPSPVEYTIHALSDVTVDMASPGFAQRPACGYALSETFAWTFSPSPADPVTTYNLSPYNLLISSTTNADAAVYSATLTNAVSYSGQNWMPSITFDITVTDPCLTTTITSFDINVGNSITQEAGVVVENQFNEPDDSAGTAVGDQSICGPKTYSVVYAADDSAQTLVTVETITANTLHKLVSTTVNEADEGTHNLKLVVSLASNTYPNLEIPFTLIIQPATCDCTLLDWIYPTQQSIITTVLKEVSDTLTINHATVDADSKATTPAIRACYRTDLGAAPGCDETTVITSVVEESSTLPSYFTLSGDVITINADNND